MDQSVVNAFMIAGGTALTGIGAWLGQRNARSASDKAEEASVKADLVLRQTEPISNGFAKKVTGSQDRLHEDIGVVKCTLDELKDLVAEIAREQQVIKVKVAVVESEVQGVKRTADSLGTRFDQHMDRRST